MKRIVIACVVCFCGFSSMAPAADNSGDKKFNSLLPALSDETPIVTHWVDSMYNTLQLESLGLDKSIFFYACKGYEYLLSEHKLQKSSLLTICDYSQSSTNKRLYVIDIENGQLLYNTYVSHGKNSGSEFATCFSNKANSHKSSLGFMITGDTYSGRAGYSMYFEGVEKGINNNVRARSIVMHGSNYVNEERADEGNAMGRSFGCPAVPYEEHKEIIDAIKGGSCFFAYANDKFYNTTSKILRAKFDWQITNNQLPLITESSNSSLDTNLNASASVK